MLETVGVGALALLAWMWVTVDGQTGRLYRGGFFGAGIAAAILIVIAANPQRGPIGWLLSFAPLRWLGLISYGLYLWHWPVDVVLDADRVGLTGWPLFLIRTAVALTIAIASYFLVEMPIRRGRAHAGAVADRDPRRRRGARHRDDHHHPRRHDGRSDLERGVPAPLAATRCCCSATPWRRASRRAWPARPSGSGSCGHRDAGCCTARSPFTNAYSNDCKWEREWRRAVDLTPPKVALAVIGVWDLFDIRLRGTDHMVSPGSPEWNAAYHAQLERLVTVLGRRGAKVVLLDDPLRRVAQGQRPGVGVPTRRVRRQPGQSRERGDPPGRRRERRRRPGRGRVRGSCAPSGAYVTYVDGVATRTDGTHLSDGGANLVGALAAAPDRPSRSTIVR